MPALRIKRRRNIAAEAKSRTAIGNRDQRITEAIANFLLASARIRQRQDRVGVRVQHRRRREKCMQKSLDRRPRPAGIEKTSAEVFDHLLVGHIVAIAQRGDVVETHRRELLRHDRLHVAAAALDEHHRHAVAEEIGGLRLHAVVAAAPQHEVLFHPD